MKGLIAKRPILYRGRMYQAGDNLPGDDAKMVDAWLENDSAERCGESQNNATDGAKGTQDGAKGTQDGAQNTQGPQDGESEKGRPGENGHRHGAGDLRGKDQGGPDRCDHGGGGLRPRRE